MYTNIFNPEAFRKFEYSVDKFNIQINDCKTMINFWNVETLTNDEIKCLLIAFNKVLKEFTELFNEFEALKKDIGEIKEEVEQIRDAFVPNEPEIKTSFDYQKEENFSIEKEFFTIKVRDVQYRNQPIKVLREEENGVIHQIGYCVDRDFPLEVIKIPKVFPDFTELESYLFTFDAHKELLFSKYYPKYYGFNSVSDPEYNLYFMELLKGKSLRNLLDNSKFRLSPRSLLFKYWIKEIYCALKDLLHCCTYTLANKITLKHIYVTDNGTKLYFKNLKFRNKRNNIQESHEKTESALLKNFLKIILELLESPNLDNIKSTFENVELDSFLAALEYTDIDLKKHLEGKNPRRITFSNLQTNVILNDDELKNSDVLELVNEYEKIFA